MEKKKSVQTSHRSVSTYYENEGELPKKKIRCPLKVITSQCSLYPESFV